MKTQYRRAVPAVLAAVLTVMAGAAAAQASVARVTNYVWGNYYTNTQLDISVGGSILPTYSNSQTFYADGQGTSGTVASSTTLPAVISGSSNGNPITSPYAVNIDARAGTTWGANHVFASVSGFDYFSSTSSQTLCPTIPGSGTCIPGAPETVQTWTYNNQAYAQAQSRWEEVYQSGGGSGNLTATFNAHVTLGATANGGSTSPTGFAGFYWAERDFSGNELASIRAYYWADSNGGSWQINTFSNQSTAASALSGYHYFQGTGTLKLDGSTVYTDSNDGTTTFSGQISADRSFAVGDVLYVDSFAQAWVNGSTVSDAENTVTLVNLKIPTGVRLYAQSGTNYVGVASGGGGGGGICLDAACVIGSGSGGGGSPVPVPEPETYALWLAGLGMLGAVGARRRRARR